MIKIWGLRFFVFAILIIFGNITLNFIDTLLWGLFGKGVHINLLFNCPLDSPGEKCTIYKEGVAAFLSILILSVLIPFQFINQRKMFDIISIGDFSS